MLTGHIQKSPNVNGRNCKDAVIKLLSLTARVLEMKTKARGLKRRWLWLDWVEGEAVLDRLRK